MNNLLFTALLIALIYYFFYYLPNQKKLNANPPLKHNQQTQTETIIEKDPAIDELKTKNQELATKLATNSQDYQKQIKDKDSQITQLQTQIRELAKRPCKPTNSKGTQTDELTNTLDNLIKDIQDLNNSLN